MRALLGSLGTPRAHAFGALFPRGGPVLDPVPVVPGCQQLPRTLHRWVLEREYVCERERVCVREREYVCERKRERASETERERDGGRIPGRQYLPRTRHRWVRPGPMLWVSI